jgi:glycosidase
MKRIFLFIIFVSSIITMQGSNKIFRIDPTNWYVGMKDTSLQLMIYGKNIREANVTTDYEGVKIDSLIKLDSPNYLILYLDIKDAKAGTMNLKFSIGRSSFNEKYVLKEREMNGDKRYGFTNADVLYMLMPDRFANGDIKNDQIKGMNTYTVNRAEPSLRHGGDIEGIRSHLDYFNKLGVTALWFTPVLENNSPDSHNYSTYHGYATTDYYRVDPRFGTNIEYRRLIDEAHHHGLKVVMDMIFNHCGFEHPWVKDIPSHDWFNTPEWLYDINKENKSTDKSTNQQSVLYQQTSYKLTPVLDPYASNIDKHETVDGWFVPTMPDLNQRNPHVIKYLIQNSEWWVETVGIDGIRMDTYPYADRNAMSLWLKTLYNEYPNFNVVGETWVTEPAYTATWQKDSKLSDKNSYLKTVMDFSFFDKLNQAKNEETDDWWNGYNRIYNSLCYDYLYSYPKSVMAFIENHDTDRFLADGTNVQLLKQALALLLTINRIPQLYYGTEVLMNGTKKVTDGNVRKDFPGGFPGDKVNAFTSVGLTQQQTDMFNWLSRLLHWRQGNEAIINGKQTQFIPYHGVYVIARRSNTHTVLTILNGTNKSVIMPVNRYAEVISKNTLAHDVITGNDIYLSKDITLTPRQTLIIEF